MSDSHTPATAETLRASNAMQRMLTLLKTIDEVMIRRERARLRESSEAEADSIYAELLAGHIRWSRQLVDRINALEQTGQETAMVVVIPRKDPTDAWGFMKSAGAPRFLAAPAGYFVGNLLAFGVITEREFARRTQRTSEIDGYSCLIDPKRPRGPSERLVWVGDPFGDLCALLSVEDGSIRPGLDIGTLLRLTDQIISRKVSPLNKARFSFIESINRYLDRHDGDSIPPPCAIERLERICERFEAALSAAR